MKTRVQMWGNSLAVRIPRAFAAETGIEEGTEVDMSVEEGELRVRPRLEGRYDLEALLADITPDNLHREEPLGPSVGAEAW